MKNFKILLVEDERQMSILMEMELSHEGYEVDLAYDGHEALEKIESFNYDLILLDIMIPYLDGLAVCKRVREKYNTPIIMLTAKGEISDKILGLDLGANDYLTKPFEIEELFARIRVYERSKNTIQNNEIIKLKDITLDNKTHEVYRGKSLIKLTKKEYDLLYMLLRNKNIVLTREKLIEEVWGFDFEGDTTIVDVFIRYLRSKIDDGFKKKLITTIRGVGYVIKD